MSNNGVLKEVTLGWQANLKGSNHHLHKIFTEVIASLGMALDLEEDKKLFHSWRVALLSTALAEEINPKSRSSVFYAGLLHDIGAIGLKNHIIHYPRLEQQLANPLIREHPYRGAQIVRALPPLFPSADMILDHHERLDGKGYPNGKRKEKIILEAQFLRAADSFDFWLRAHPKISYYEFQDTFKENSQNELSKEVCLSTLKVLKKNDFYKKILDDENLPGFMKEASSSFLGMNFPPYVDLLGSTLNLYAEVIDAKHTYTAGHSKRVSDYSVLLAVALGLPHDEVTKIKWAGLLHDIGKIAIPKRILDKPGALTKKEFEVIKKHPLYTMEILNMVSEFKDVSEIAGHDHERFDGTGYPYGLKGETIPLGSRILAVADSLDALTSNRSYRLPLTFKEALGIIRAGSSRQYDPQVVEVATSVFS